MKPSGCGALNRIADTLTRLVAHDALALITRIGIAAIFLLSGRTKVDGLLTVNDSAVTLFREEYRLPLLPPELAAHLATHAEHLFLLLIVTVHGTGAGAAGAAVIQFFVYLMHGRRTRHGRRWLLYLSDGAVARRSITGSGFTERPQPRARPLASACGATSRKEAAASHIDFAPNHVVGAVAGRSQSTGS
jgi:putative oxidoreductase